MDKEEFWNTLRLPTQRNCTNCTGRCKTQIGCPTRNVCIRLTNDKNDDRHRTIYIGKVPEEVFKNRLSDNRFLKNNELMTTLKSYGLDMEHPENWEYLWEWNGETIK